MTNAHDSTDAQREQAHLISGSVASSLAVAYCSMTDFPDPSLIDQVLHDKSGEPAQIAARCEQTLAATSELAGHLASFVQAGFQFVDSSILEPLIKIGEH